MIRKRFDEILFICVADNNATLRNTEISIQKIRLSLKVALTAFIKSKIIGTGIITVIR